MKEMVGALIRNLRESRGLSRSQTAECAGVAGSTLSRWEAGAHLPCLPELEQVLAALQAPAEQSARLVGLVDGARGMRRARHTLDQTLKSCAEQTGVPLRPVVAGALLRALRRRQDLSLEQLALSLGVSHTTVGRWEQGRTTPSPLKRMALLELLDATPREQTALHDCRCLLKEPEGTVDSEPPEQVRASLRARMLCAHDTKLDLDFLRLEARLSTAAALPAARQTLLALYHDYAEWLIYCRRIDEAGEYAGRALELASARMCTDLVLRGTVSLAAHALVFGARRTTPSHGIELLRNWLPYAPTELHKARIYRSLAAFACLDNRWRAARDLLDRAQRGAGSESAFQEGCRLLQSWILLHMGAPHAARSELPAGFQSVPALRWEEARLRMHIYDADGDTLPARFWEAQARMLDAASVSGRRNDWKEDDRPLRIHCYVPARTRGSAQAPLQ